MAEKEMTVSISKGKKSESSDAHNDRKTNLENATEEKRKKFYEKKGHQHIKQEYTYLNEDLKIEKPVDAYDRLFEESVKEFNDKKTRRDRKIGKGKALTRAEKAKKVLIWSDIQRFRRMKVKDREIALADLKKKEPKLAETVKKELKATQDMTLREIGKEVTQAKHAKTLGQALYEKQKQGSKRPAVEFVIQIGNASDFNKIDKNGNIVKSYDRKDPNGIWQKSKKVLEKYYQDFPKNNPNLEPINASIHMDEEGTPHLHLKAVPVADSDQMMLRGSGRVDKNGVKHKARHVGLSVKPSFNGALECEGFARDPKDNRSQFKAWQNREADTLAKIMQEELGVTRKKGLTNHIKDIHQYKYIKRLEAEESKKYLAQKAQHEKEIADLKAQKATAQAELDDVKADAQTTWDTLSGQNKQIKANQQTLADQKEKLDQINLFPDLLANFQSQSKQAKQEKEDAETARDKALKVKEEAEEAKKQAEEQAKNANQNLISQLTQQKRKQEQKQHELDNREFGHMNRLTRKRTGGIKQKEDELQARESALDAQEKDINAVELGGTDSKGVIHGSLKAREKTVVEREQALDKQKSDLERRESQFRQKVKNLVHTFRFEYILYGLTQNKAVVQKYSETQINGIATYYTTDKPESRQQTENIVFGGDTQKAPYPRLKAFISAVKHTFFKKDNPLDEIAKLGDNIGKSTRPGVGGKPKQIENENIQNQNELDDDINNPFN